MHSSIWLTRSLALLTGLTILGTMPLAWAEAPLPRTLTVTGQGKEDIPTTLAQVELGVEITQPTAAQAQIEVAERSNRVVAFLRSRSVQELQTTGVRLQANYEYNNNKRTANGYTGINTVSFRLPTSEVGAVLDQAVAQGATRINGISFMASETAIAAAQKVALQRATEDAQGQAQAVLKALNFSAKEVVGIAINGAPTPPSPRLMTMTQADGLAAAAPPSPIMGGEQSVTAAVTLQISY